MLIFIAFCLLLATGQMQYFRPKDVWALNACMAIEFLCEVAMFKEQLLP